MKFYYTLSLIAVSITPLIASCNDKSTVINKGAVVEMIKVEDIDWDEILLEKPSIKRQDYRAFTYSFPKDRAIVEALQKVNRERRRLCWFSTCVALSGLLKLFVFNYFWKYIYRSS